MKKVLYAVASIILIIILFLGYLSVSETQKKLYSNKQDVIKDNAIKRGWIPDILPDSAYDINEVHDIDTNMIEGSFQYLEKDENNLLNAISKNSNFKFEVDKEKNKVLFFNNK